MAELREFQVNTGVAHPNQEIITVKNTGEGPAGWMADGQTVSLPPGDVQRMPRWVFLLGLRYPDHGGLKELAAGDAGHEYEKNQQKLLKAEIEKRKAELEAETQRLKDLEAQLKAAAKEGKVDAKS